MKKSELLHIIDQNLLDKLFGFCYSRTPGSQQAQELCSDIVYELVKTANSEGEIGAENGDNAALYAFVWRVARNVYADYAEHRRRETARAATGDTDALFALLSDEDDTEEREARERDSEALRRIHRQIANLTRAYREVMIAYYLDGQSVREIAAAQGTSETAIRQRLFSARETVRKEVTDMEYTTQTKPISLRHLDLILWGNGNPLTGDPRELISRQLSKHVAWLCRHREASAREIAEELNVPMLYVEEELELQTRGVGETHYGTLRRLPNGKYTTNIILLSKEEFEAGRAPYQKLYPAMCDIIIDFIETHEKDYLAFPYLNHRVDLNLVLWQHIRVLSDKLGDMVEKILRETYFADVTLSDRPFTTFGYEKLDTPIGFCGWDGILGKNLCGYREVALENLYTPTLKQHFHCGHDIASDEKIHLAIRAIRGLPVSELDEDEREQAAKAIECGYLTREGDTLYTKILVCDAEDAKTVYLVDSEINDAIRPLAEQVAEGTAKWVRSLLPDHLLPDYNMISNLAAAGSFDALSQTLIERGIITLPEGGVGAEGCWMTVKTENH